jgi:hypothetical protein
MSLKSPVKPGFLLLCARLSALVMHTGERIAAVSFSASAVTWSASKRPASARSHVKRAWHNRSLSIVQSSNDHVERGMHPLRRAIIRKIGGIAAICAMLLLSLAPAASQALEHARIDALLTSVCAADAQASRSIGHSDFHHLNHEALAHLQACAYCDLIAHAPAPPTALQGIGSMPDARRPFTSPPLDGAPRSARLRAAQPRAPPVAV